MWWESGVHSVLRWLPETSIRQYVHDKEEKRRGGGEKKRKRKGDREREMTKARSTGKNIWSVRSGGEETGDRIEDC